MSARVAPAIARNKSGRMYSHQNLSLFLQHVSFLISRMPQAEYDDYIVELRDAVQRLAPITNSVSGHNLQDINQLINDLEYPELRALLDVIVGRVAKFIAPVDRQIKCDRFVTAYCRLQAANERAIQADRAIISRQNSQKMVDLISYDLLSSNDSADGGQQRAITLPPLSPLRRSRSELPIRPNTAPSMPSARKFGNMPRKGKLFVSTLHLDKNISSVMCRGIAAYF